MKGGLTSNRNLWVQSESSNCSFTDLGGNNIEAERYDNNFMVRLFLVHISPMIPLHMVRRGKSFLLKGNFTCFFFFYCLFMT